MGRARKLSDPRSTASTSRRRSASAELEPDLRAPPPAQRPASSSTVLPSPAHSSPQEEPRPSCSGSTSSTRSSSTEVSCPAAPLLHLPDIQQLLRPERATLTPSLRVDDMFDLLRSIPTDMDYKGQKLAEQIFQGIILVSAVIGFIYGYLTEQFCWTVYIVMAGFALSCVLTLPPWPIYRRNPLKWLPVQELTTDDKKPADKKVKRHLKN